MPDGICLFPFVLRHGINAFQIVIAQLLHIFRQAVCHNALAIVEGRGAVKGIDGLAVVLDAHIVYIEKGHPCLLGQPAENPVALAVLAKGIRRGGNIHQHIHALAAQNLHRGQVVVIAPAVLAEKGADGIAAPLEGELQRAQQLFSRGMKLLCQLPEAEKMTGVVKLPVVGHQCLDDERIRHVLRLHQPALMGKEQGVVLAHPAVIVLLVPVRGYVAEDNGNILRSGNNVLAAFLAVPDKSSLLPGIPQQVARHGHFRENDDICLMFLCFLNHGQHIGGIFIGMPWNDLHLGNGNF